MLDYHGSHAALQEFADTLRSSTFADPTLVTASQDATAALKAEPGCALVGCLLHHLVAHASADGFELDLLTRAAGLWRRGSDVCDRLGRVRADLESAMEDPSAPGAADRFNAASVSAQELANDVVGLRMEVDEVRSAALDFRHLPPHPRQGDEPTDRWGWGDLVAGRCTQTLVRALFARATDTRTLSVALGATAAYGGHVAGSAWLGHTVGGPRRSHRHRDRLARNAVGARLRSTQPGAWSHSDMADELSADPAGPGLAPDLQALLEDSLRDTYDTARTLPLGDLHVGHERLVAHLRLLDAFVMPAPPAPPGQFWMAKLWADPANPPPLLRPQDVDVVGQDGGGVAVQMGPGEPGPGTAGDADSTKVAKGCGILVLAIILIDLLQAFVQCVAQWAQGDTCTFWENMLLSKLWEQDPPDPRDPTNPGVGEDALTSIGAAPQAAQFVGVLFDGHAQAYEAMSRARVFLALTGLVLPERVTGLPVFEQFMSAAPTEQWPHREEADPPGTFHLPPTSPIENHAVTPSPYPSSVGPEAIFASPTLRATTTSLTLWARAVLGEDVDLDLDLDADRGALHSCWETLGSIHDDPIDVRVLGPGEQ